MAVEVSEPGVGVILVTLSAPGRHNALDESAYRQLSELWPRLEASSARCVVVTGAGGTFCSGADLSAGLMTLPDLDQLIDCALLKTKVFRKPLIAAVSGACVAGGLELVLSCDVRLCSPDCRFGFPEAKWGIFPAGGAALRLADEIGHANAAELLLTGRLFGSDEALRLGLMNRIVTGRPVLDEALEVAHAIAQNSPAVVRAIKTYMCAARNPDEWLRTLELGLTHEVRASADAREGAAAFLAKRPPAYETPEAVRP